MDIIRRPGKSEYFEYYGTYISRVPEGDIIAILGGQLDEMLALLRGIPEEKGDYRYAPGKWSLKEVMGHIIDTERVFSYRALSFARGDSHAIPGMDQDEWVAGANFAARTLVDLVEEFRHLRAANLVLAGSFDEAILERTGEASGNHFTVRSILFILAGHAIHHMSVIKERYL